MKKSNKKTSGIFLFCLIVITFFSSCLKKDLPEYPMYGDTNIDKVYVEYRYNGTANYNGQPIVAYQQFSVTQTIDQPTSTINLSINVPAASASFPITERDKVAQNNLIIYFDISTAATVAPLPSTPKPGELTDLTRPQQYEVTAANGAKRTWTIKVTSFNK